MFQLGDFTFTEISSRDDIQRFNKIVAMTFRTEFQRNFGNRKRVDLDRIIQEHTAMDARYEGAIVRFIVTCGKESVGAVSMFFAHPENGLPIEDINHEIDLTSYRRNGTVAEICRLSILNKYRLKPLVFKGLLRCMIDLASERQASYILNDVFSFRVSTYDEIGFVPMIEAPRTTPEDSLGFGIAMQPPIINLYVTERYFSRLVVRNIARSALNIMKRLTIYFSPNRSMGAET